MCSRARGQLALGSQHKGEINLYYAESLRFQGTRLEQLNQPRLTDPSSDTLQLQLSRGSLLKLTSFLNHAPPPAIQILPTSLNASNLEHFPE